MAGADSPVTVSPVTDSAVTDSAVTDSAVTVHVLMPTAAFDLVLDGD